MLKIFNILIRLIGAIHLTGVIAYLFQAIPPADLDPLGNKMGGMAKYLTTWTNIALAFYFWFALINDIISGCKDDKNQLLTKIKDFMFFSSIFPMTTVVTLMFWGIYAVDRDLIFPKEAEQYFPSWLNHSLHTAIFLYAVLELSTSYHKPNSKKSHLLGVTAIFGAYAMWNHIVYFMTGYWIYYIYSCLSWFGIEILTAFVQLLAYGSLFLGLWGNHIIWRRKVEEEKFEVGSSSQNIGSC